MKTYYLGLLLTITCFVANAQQPISIVRTDMPNINDTFRYSIVDNLLGLIDLNDTGADMVWNYSTLGSFTQRVDTMVDPVFGTPLVYNITFSNFFDMNHFATIAGRNVLGQFNQNFISIENVYDFFRETNGFYANVGLGLTINGFPLTSVMEPRDLVYEFPLEYGDADNSFGQYGVDVPQFGYFGQKISRQNTVDGWGELTTRFGTFDALRVFTLLNITDTFSIQGFGFEQPRPTQFEIKWLAKNIGAPVLSVRGQILFNQRVVNTVEYLDSLRDFTASTFPPEPVDTTSNPADTTSSGIFDILTPENIAVHPNPFTESFQIRLNLPEAAILHVQVLDITGKMVADLGIRRLSAGSQLWNCDLSSYAISSGLYHLVISDSNGGRLVKKMVRQ
ncbi:MAG: T9SS type A sorting domain-containing protein [Flavobacteriales bacterium]|nr:T9SS type A sorting domain-containing protein [Flavobacteriales bacterium]